MITSKGNIARETDGGLVQSYGHCTTLLWNTYLSKCSSLALQRDFTSSESAGRREKGVVQSGELFEEKICCSATGLIKRITLLARGGRQMHGVCRPPVKQ